MWHDCQMLTHEEINSNSPDASPEFRRATEKSCAIVYIPLKWKTLKKAVISQKQEKLKTNLKCKEES